MSGDRIQKIHSGFLYTSASLGLLYIKKMSSVIPFAFNAVELCAVTINQKPWTRAREVCKVLEYGKATKSADIVKHLCSKENYAHKWQLTELVSETNFLNWQRDSRKDDY